MTHGHIPRNTQVEFHTHALQHARTREDAQSTARARTRAPTRAYPRPHTPPRVVTHLQTQNLRDGESPIQEFEEGLHLVAPLLCCLNHDIIMLLNVRLDCLTSVQRLTNL